MGLWNSVAGTIRIRITSADIPGALKVLTEADILLHDIVFESDLAVLLTISRRDFKATDRLLKKKGDRCEPAKKWGVFWTLCQVRRRLVLLTGLLILTIMTLYIPTRIYFFEIKGNDNIAAKWILEKAESNGLYFGCVRSEIRSEQLKNSLLEQIPELDWVGITTAGCVATIEVKENTTTEANKNAEYPVSNIVASSDGVIESITVTKGTALCQPGQAVQTGQVLISGYEDCGLIIKASRAEGDVFAKTFHFLQTVTPVFTELRTTEAKSETNFSIQIGKNIINFVNNSGISPTGCVKMYSREYVTLPGGFQLPLAMIREEVIYYQTETVSLPLETFDWVENAADQYMLSQMTAGEVLQKRTGLELIDDICLLRAEYNCREQIGKNRIEEILN